ncbi:hypothetical protein EDB86DRAFT_611018 [Lactarius hatsudake]|nr:hypothetical protein EDB86DRAFT_611018 [Lactarius hatsudake]
MHRGNNSAYPSPSLNHNRLPDRSLDISPAVLPSSIARQPRLPYTRLSLFTRPRPSQRRPRRSTLHHSCPQTSTPSQASRWRSFKNLPARRSRSTCALSHLHSSPDPPDPVRNLQETQQFAIPQGFCYEGAAVGAHGLLATSPAAEPTPTSDSGACATTTNSAPATATDPDGLQDASLDLDLDLDISMDLGDGPVPAGEDESVDMHAVVVGDAPPHFPPPPLGTAGTHNHPDAPMLGFVIPETEQSTRSVLGGGGNLSPEKLGDDPSSPVRGFGGVQPPRATDGDDEEEDVMGTLFENTSDDDFVPPSGLGKGKDRAVVVDGVVESSESVAAAAGSTMWRKSWRKELADEVEDGQDDGSDDDSSPDYGLRAHAISAPVFINARRKKRSTASSSSGVLPWGLTFCHHCRRRHPAQDALYVDQGVDGRAIPQLVCDLCIEQRYPQLTFDRSAEDFECPACCNYCNCSLCSRKRGEAYIPERDGGWRIWIARQGGTHRATPIPAKKSKSKSKDLGTAPATTKKPTTMMTTMTTDARVFDESWSATAVFTVSGEPLGSAFLQGNKARIVPVS